MAQRPISSLRADSLNSALILIQVNVAYHGVEFDAGSNVVYAVVAIFVVVERMAIQNEGWSLLVKIGREEGTAKVLGDDFDGSNYAQSVLLITDFLESHLLCICESLKLRSGWPFKVIFAFIINISFKHWQLADSVF